MRRRVAIGAIVRTLGGPATYARELVAALAARRPSDLEYVVLTDGPEAFDAAGVETCHLPLGSAYAQVIWDHALVPTALRRVRADLYHGTKNTLPVLLSCRPVVTIHDLAVYEHPDSFAALQRWHLKTHLPWAARQAAAILTVSEHAGSDLRARFPTCASKVQVVPNGLRSDLRRVDDPAELAAFRRRHGLGDGPLVAYLGTLQPRKNVELLASAFGRLVDVLPDAELVLAGRIRPGYKPSLPRERVRLIGPLPDDELATFYSSASVLVSPSLYEGFGLTLLEAMACGCPVVALRRSAVPEVVGDAAALLDEPNEDDLAIALRQILTEPGWADELRTRGLARAKRFSWAAAAEAVEGVYRRALDG